MSTDLRWLAVEDARTRLEAASELYERERADMASRRQLVDEMWADVEAAEDAYQDAVAAAVGAGGPPEYVPDDVEAAWAADLYADAAEEYRRELAGC